MSLGIRKFSILCISFLASKSSKMYSWVYKYPPKLNGNIHQFLSQHSLSLSLCLSMTATSRSFLNHSNTADMELKSKIIQTFRVYPASKGSHGFKMRLLTCFYFEHYNMAHNDSFVLLCLIRFLRRDFICNSNSSGASLWEQVGNV